MAQQIKPFAEPERLAFIEAGLLHQNAVAAVLVGESCLEDREYLRAIVKGGYSYINSAQVGFWVEYGLRYMGEPELLNCLNELPQTPFIKKLALREFKRQTKANYKPHHGPKG